MPEERAVLAEHLRIRNVDAVLAENRELYETLYRRIEDNRAPQGFRTGKSNSVLKVLVHMFPPPMAELVIHLGAQGKKAEQVAAETGKPLEYVKAMLHEYWLRGVAGSKAVVEEQGYILPRGHTIVLGEFPFCDGVGGTRKFWEEDEEKEVGILLSKIYFEEGWLYEWAAFKESPYMVLVDERFVDDPSSMEPWEKGSEQILQSNDVGVTRCACRVRHGLYNKCKWTLEKPMIDMCIQWGRGMQNYVDRDAGVYCSKEEALDALWYGIDNGLVAVASAKDTPGGISGFICQCCPDCCHILATWTKLGIYDTGVRRSNFDPRIALDKCTFEEELLCVKACPSPATMWYHPATQADGSDEFIGVNLEKCMGCGLCAGACPQKAIKMVKTRSWVPPAYEDKVKAGRLEFIDKASAL